MPVPCALTLLRSHPVATQGIEFEQTNAGPQYGAAVAAVFALNGQVPGRLLTSELRVCCLCAVSWAHRTGSPTRTVSTRTTCTDCWPRPRGQCTGGRWLSRWCCEKAAEAQASSQGLGVHDG